MSRTASVRAARPAAVIRYGRRRRSPPTGSMRPRSSSRVMAPYTVPGPSATPANASMSRVRA